MKYLRHLKYGFVVLLLAFVGSVWIVSLIKQLMPVLIPMFVIALIFDVLFGKRGMF